MTLAPLILLLLTNGPGDGPNDVARFDPLPPKPATLVHIFDGDTVCLDVHDSIVIRAGRTYHDTHTEDVRIAGYDAPERFTPRGPAATEALAYLLSLGTVWVEWTGDVTFGRIVGEVTVVTESGYVIDVASAMRRMGHVK